MINKVISSKINKPVWVPISFLFKDRIRGQVIHHVKKPVWDQVWDEINFKVWRRTENQVRRQVKEECQIR